MIPPLGPLHTVNRPPGAGVLESCLAHLTEGAALLLIEDGVYAALAGSAVAPRLTEAGGRHALYVLGPDLDRRGLARRALVPGMRVVDYQGFVALAANHPLVQSWV
jgi:tRNA 2-thiouridine synthesizing protein B